MGNKVNKYQNNNNFLTLHKPVEVNLAADHSDISDGSPLVKTIYRNIVSSRSNNEIEKKPKQINK